MAGLIINEIECFLKTVKIIEDITDRSNFNMKNLIFVMLMSEIMYNGVLNISQHP